MKVMVRILQHTRTGAAEFGGLKSPGEPHSGSTASLATVRSHAVGVDPLNRKNTMAAQPLFWLLNCVRNQSTIYARLFGHTCVRYCRVEYIPDHLRVMASDERRFWAMVFLGRKSQMGHASGNFRWDGGDRDCARFDKDDPPQERQDVGSLTLPATWFDPPPGKTRRRGDTNVPAGHNSI